MARYNLLDEGWIPCLRSSTAPPEYLSIREVFHQAHALRQIADPAPTVTISIHRLLLAVLHRSLDGPRSTNEWGAVWRQGAWDTARIDAYLDRWHDRFDLFSDDHPFYQTPALASSTLKEINQITHERASDRNRPLLFDHSLPGMGLTPADAARYLLAQQNFSVGGMFSLSPGEGSYEKFAPASPLLKSAICLVAGASVFQTLMLNWVRYNRETEMPFVFRGDDQPAWERDEPVTVRERFPDGWIDLLTWQCRRILLQPMRRGDGALTVTHAALMQGYRLPEAFELATSEPMVAYVENARAQQGHSGATPPWIPVGLITGRLAWRDSNALFQSAADRRRPRTLDWLQLLIDRGQLTSQPLFPLDVYGLMPDQAKTADWRHETLPLPGAFIQTPEMVEPLRRGLELAEHVGQLLTARVLNLQIKPRPVRGSSPLRVLGEELLRSTSGLAPNAKAATELALHLSPEAGYWGAMEEPFRAFVTTLPADFIIDASGDVTEHGEAARVWGQAVERVARARFGELAQGLGTSTRTLRAVALAEERFSRCLSDILAAYHALVPHEPSDDADHHSKTA